MQRGLSAIAELHVLYCVALTVLHTASSGGGYCSNNVSHVTAWLCDVTMTSRVLLGAWQVLGDVMCLVRERVRLLIVSCQWLAVRGNRTPHQRQLNGSTLTFVRSVTRTSTSVVIRRYMVAS